MQKNKAKVSRNVSSDKPLAVVQTVVDFAPFSCCVRLLTGESKDVNAYCRKAFGVEYDVFDVIDRGVPNRAEFDTFLDAEGENQFYVIWLRTFKCSAESIGELTREAVHAVNSMLEDLGAMDRNCNDEVEAMCVEHLVKTVLNARFCSNDGKLVVKPR